MSDNSAIVMVSTGRIQPGARLFRALNNEEMTELMGSIKNNGILQALLVEKGQDGGYTLLAGFNRLDAAKRLDLAEVPCRIVTANEKVAAIFDTDLIRRNLDLDEKTKMRKKRDEYKKENRNSMAQHLIAEFKNITPYLNENTLQYLCDIPTEEQKRIYNAMPIKIIEDTEKLTQMEKQLQESEKENQRLRDFKAKSEKELKSYEDYKKNYEVLQQTRQKELEKLVDEKRKQLEEEYKDADDKIRIAYEKAKEEVEKNLKDDIESAQAHSQRMSVEVGKKNEEIKILQDEIKKFDQTKNDGEIEKNKLKNRLKLLDNIVSAVASPASVADRCKIIVTEADQVRNTITRLGQDVLLKEKDTRLAIKKHLADVRDIFDEVEKFINSIKPLREEGDEILQ
ncbi:MAG: ParB N-terminal domain-containing protein [Proteobacteria bacterium]|nr:ParB N-terminal domain-containing protein [Pseudomonadota bacterium]